MLNRHRDANWGLDERGDWRFVLMLGLAAASGIAALLVYTMLD